MEFVTKRTPSNAKCAWCRRRFKPKAVGRPAVYCSVSFRQRAYEKRRWTPYAAADAIALDMLPWAARKRLIQEVRREHMLELIKNGTVPLVEIAQIDGVLDAVPVPKRRPLLAEIEEKCRDRADDGGLATIARWRRSNPGIKTRRH